VRRRGGAMRWSGVEESGGEEAAVRELRGMVAKSLRQAKPMHSQLASTRQKMCARVP
jgi:hypothetical protein